RTALHPARRERSARAAGGVGGDRARATGEGDPVRARRLSGRGALDREALESDRLVHAGGRVPRRSPGIALGTMAPSGALAEWLGSGLQSRARRFDSGRRLPAPSYGPWTFLSL